MNKYYGAPPEILGDFHLECPEFMYYVYLPISIPDDAAIPKNLMWTCPLIATAIDDYERTMEVADEMYVYITVKHMFIPAGTIPNRPGWHIDGFGTEDINYIWCNNTPTEFCVQEFNLSDDHDLSMKQMGMQARSENIVTYGVNKLLRLDNSVVHRVATAQESGVRTFVKVSISKEQYRLKGNSHNYLLDYNWEMLDRESTRNCPQGRK